MTKRNVTRQFGAFMITVERLKPLDVERVKNIQLADEQIKFAGTAEAFLLSGSDTIHLHVIKHNEDVVGFFKLDTAYAAGYDFCSERGLGLRSFAVDKNQQGKGIGTGSVKALFPYLKSNYAEYDSIYLTVNCKNPGAVSCYKKGGFVDTNEKYLGGEAGPQHIMKGQIR